MEAWKDYGEVFLDLYLMVVSPLAEVMDVCEVDQVLSTAILAVIVDVLNPF